jgi:flagellar M-ring protein FliF
MAETGQVESTALQKTAGNAVSASAGSPAGRAMEMVSSLRERVMALPAGKRTWLLASVAFVAAMCAAMVWFAGRTDWKTLFTGLDGKDVAQVSQELAAAGIPYQMTPDGGGVQVPAEMLDKARMEVATKGMPQTGRLGFELFDKPNWVGSEFDE